jgi:hypothetical protein
MWFMLNVKANIRFLMVLSLFGLCRLSPALAEKLSIIDNDTVRVGLDLEKGAAITWLSWKAHPRNMVNIADPGRLIQQSYYAGRTLNRTPEGQSAAWSPWPWNPIQGGGVGSWARISEHRNDGKTLFAETIPKLWDMPNEEAAAIMRQWTTFEPLMSNVVVVRCEFISNRDVDDRWAPTSLRAQEVPACYFTRNFSQAQTYLGDGKWRRETQPPGPPWGHAEPPLNAMAFFEENGQGVAVFSPVSSTAWNFGPHGGGPTDEPTAGPCMHVAPIVRILLGPKSRYEYRYWLVVGDAKSISERLDALIRKYGHETAEFEREVQLNR